MPMDGVVEAVAAVGNVLGNARESFGVRVGGVVSPTSGSPTTLAAAFFGSGQTVSASNNQSNVLAGFSSALGEQDAAANAHVQSVLASQNAGIGQLDDAITGTQAKVTSLAPATNTHGGLLALVDALVQGLQQAGQAMTNGNTDASTHAAGQAQLAANYSGLVSSPGGGVAQPATLAPMGGLSMGATTTGTVATTAATQPTMTAMQVWVPASAAAAATASTTAQTASAQQAASQSAAQPATLTGAVTKTGAPDAAPIHLDSVQYNPTPHAASGQAAYTNYARQALTLMGIDPNSTAGQKWLAGMVHAARNESTWRPWAANNDPHDANAWGPIISDGSHQHSTRGLMQLTPGNFAAYHQGGSNGQPPTSNNIYDPIANITASLNYLHATYNVNWDASNLYQKVQQFNPSASAKGY